MIRSLAYQLGVEYPMMGQFLVDSLSILDVLCLTEVGAIMQYIVIVDPLLT